MLPDTKGRNMTIRRPKISRAIALLLLLAAVALTVTSALAGKLTDTYSGQQASSQRNVSTAPVAPTIPDSKGADSLSNRLSPHVVDDLSS